MKTGRFAQAQSDASRAVGIAAKLLAPEQDYVQFSQEIAAEYALIKNRVEARREKRAFLTRDGSRQCHEF